MLEGLRVILDDPSFHFPDYRPAREDIPEEDQVWVAKNVYEGVHPAEPVLCPFWEFGLKLARLMGEDVLDFFFWLQGVWDSLAVFSSQSADESARSIHIPLGLK